MHMLCSAETVFVQGNFLGYAMQFSINRSSRQLFNEHVIIVEINSLRITVLSFKVDFLWQKYLQTMSMPYDFNGFIGSYILANFKSHYLITLSAWLLPA
jgi:hypothetical protein